MWEHSSGLVKMHLNCQDVLTEIVVASAQGEHEGPRMVALLLAELALNLVVKMNNADKS